MLAALLLAAACTPLPVCGSSQPAPVALIQSVGADLGITGTPSMALPAPVLLGSTIIIAVRAGGHSSHALTASDSHGNTYSLLGSVAAPGPSTLAMFAAKPNATGPLNVTVRDAATPGPIRMVVREYAGLGALGAATAQGGSGLSVPLGGSLAAVVTGGSQSGVVADEPVEAVTGKLFALHGSASLGLSAATSWTSLTVALPATSGPCESPTPVLTWDQSTHALLAGYSIWRNEIGGTPQKAVDLPCERFDMDEDGTAETRACRGPDLWYPLQRAADFAPGTAYEIRITAYTSTGLVSPLSEPLLYCPRAICAKPGPCS